jgi:hypothetical protein
MEDAIRAIEDEWDGCCSEYPATQIIYDTTEAIERLPIIQPRRGKWIDDGSELGCQCSQCGKTLDEYVNCGTEYMTLTEIPKFCPNCGAKMEVNNESN